MKKDKELFDLDFAEIEARVIAAMAEGNKSIVDYPSVTGRLEPPRDDTMRRLREFTRKCLDDK